MEQRVSGARGRLSIPAGDGLELRGVSTADCARLYAAIDRNRARLSEWLPWLTPTFKSSDLAAFLLQRELDNADRISLTTSIWLNDELCGAIGLHAIDQRDRNTSIGYWLDAAFEGRGIMTRACGAIITEGFREYGLHRIEIRCATGNTKSAAVPLRLGFIEEGRLREAEWLFDHWVDLRVFSMLEQDWK